MRFHASRYCRWPLSSGLFTPWFQIFVDDCRIYQMWITSCLPDLHAIGSNHVFWKHWTAPCPMLLKHLESDWRMNFVFCGALVQLRLRTRINVAGGSINICRNTYRGKCSLTSVAIMMWNGLCSENLADGDWTGFLICRQSARNVCWFCWALRQLPELASTIGGSFAMAGVLGGDFRRHIRDVCLDVKTKTL